MSSIWSRLGNLIGDGLSSWRRSTAEGVRPFACRWPQLHEGTSPAETVARIIELSRLLDGPERESAKSVLDRFSSTCEELSTTTIDVSNARRIAEILSGDLSLDKLSGEDPLLHFLVAERLLELLVDSTGKVPVCATHSTVFWKLITEAGESADPAEFEAFRRWLAEHKRG